MITHQKANLSDILIFYAKGFKSAKGLKFVVPPKAIAVDVCKDSVVFEFITEDKPSTEPARTKGKG